MKAREAAENFEKCVEELAGCMVVQNVEAAALTVMTLELVRGLNARDEQIEQIERRCCVIFDKMCKLPSVVQSY